ncbi:hypothetical protein [Sterolibacterium denitrificans]|uniref:hypothetical protein n=1 Tax=Sterolibacterium denitrificans TaxID=157592 RepID=UPI000831FF89|nr:hypothetical protein [Sterolibacterium denitrificans]
MPSVEALLVSGGDARIALDPASGCNIYGCPPRPAPRLLAFGSSTASPVSPAGLAAATQLHARLQRSLAAGATVAAACARQIHAEELARQRGELQSLYADAAADIIFASSGSELHLIAAQLAAANAAQALRIVGIAAAETGSQVPAALRGLHFARHGAEDGRPIIAGRTLEFVDVAVRDAGGRPRPPAEVDADIGAQVLAAAAEDRQVLLIVADVAKTGLLAPTPACVMALQRQLGARLTILVDACQLRLAPATLQAWLAQGCLVALTGSKFIGGPSFSGALLVPSRLAARWRNTAVPASLRAYSAQAAWPAGWRVDALPDTPNFGLLLRWEAALAEMRAFHALPDAGVRRILEHCAAAVRDRLARDPLLEALPVPPLERHALPGGEGEGAPAARWDTCQTIFPFLLRRPDGRYLDAAATAAIQRDLLRGASENGNVGLRCQFGQPVACGQRDGQAIAALRLCFSARQIVAAAQGPAALAALSAQALLALDRVAARLRAAALP